MNEHPFNGYVNVLDFGAKPNSFQDDTDAFKKALSLNRGVFVPGGIYFISEPIVLENQNLVGSGIFATQIVSVNADALSPIIRAGRSCTISDMLIKYKEGLVTGNEKTGERVGLLLSTQRWPLQRGSSVRNVRIEEVGTGIYSPADESLSGPFSVHFDTLEITGFSYRGIDFCSPNRTGNVFTNLFVNSQKENVDALISMEGEDSELSMNQINLEHSRCKTALRLFDVRAFSIATLHLESINITEAGGAMIDINGSSGSIDVLTVYYSILDHENISIVRIGDAAYDIHADWAWFCPTTATFLKVGTLHVKGINDPNWQVYGRRDGGLLMDSAGGFLFFTRPTDAKGDYYVQVDNYVWYSFQKDGSIYESCPCDPHGRITFTKKGVLPPGGPTDERPTQRLCRFSTRYFDTDLGREVIWDGSEWR